MNSNRGGKREGAGRKGHVPPLKRVELGLTDEQMKLLRKWGRGSMSAGLRWLIDQAKDVVYKPVDPPSGSTGEQA